MHVFIRISRTVSKAITRKYDRMSIPTHLMTGIRGFMEVLDGKFIPLALASTKRGKNDGDSEGLCTEVAGL